MFKVPTKELAERRRGGKVRQANALIRHSSDVAFAVPLLKELLSGSYGSFQIDLFAAANELVGTSFSIPRAE